MLIYEDIDRISEDNREQISKLFDLSEKLLHHNVKVIYEFDLDKLAKLGFDRIYIEKYIPYIIHLTNIPPRKLIENAIEELGLERCCLNRKDFDFLFHKIYGERFLEKVFGFSWEGFLEMRNITPRKVKAYVAEVNTVIKLPEFARDENRQTVIAFFYMKHFFTDIYEELEFEEDMIDEVQFAYRTDRSDMLHHDSIMGLVEKCRLGEVRAASEEEETETSHAGLSARDIKAMFCCDDRNDVSVSNANKLGLLQLLGYKIAYHQEARDLETRMDTEVRTGDERVGVLLNQEKSNIEKIEHNKKISHLIRNLYRNGRSEFTDAEAVADRFVKTVLNQNWADWEQNWKVFCSNAYHGKILKDNQTIFHLGMDIFADLFQALWIYLSRKDMGLEDKEDILDKALVFYQVQGTHTDQLDLEKIVILHFCEPVSRKVLLKVFQYFNRLQVTGNFNREKVYWNFLKKFVGEADEKIERMSRFNEIRK